MVNRKFYGILLVIILLVEFGFASGFLLKDVGGSSSGKVTKRDGTGAMSSSDLRGAFDVSSSSVSGDVPLGYIGTPRTSWAILFYDPSLMRFTISYRVRLTGAYLQDNVVNSAVMGFYAASCLYSSDDPYHAIKDKDGNDIKIDESSQTEIEESRVFYLSSAPNFNSLRWSFYGAAFGKTWDAVQAEMEAKPFDWWHDNYRLHELLDMVLLIVGVAVAVVSAQPEVGAAAAEVALDDFMATEALKAAAEYAVGVYRNLAIELLDAWLHKRAAQGSWSSVLVGIDEQRVWSSPSISVGVNGPNEGDDTNNWWEDNQGAYQLGTYTVHVIAYQVNAIKIEFFTPKGGTMITDKSFFEGDPSYSLYYENYVCNRAGSNCYYNVSYEKDAVSNGVYDQLYKLMKHDACGYPYFEFTLHAIVDYEVSAAERNMYEGYNEGQNLIAYATGWGVGNGQVSPTETRSWINVKIKWVSAVTNMVRQALVVAICCAALPLYLLYEKTKTVVVVIPYPPYQNPKYLLAHPPGSLEGINIQYCGPRPPTKNIAIDLPDPSYNCVIIVPQYPTAGDWRATIAYDPYNAFYYGQVVSVPSTLADDSCIAVQLSFPFLDKSLNVNHPTADEILSTTAKSPANMMFVVPVLPQQGQVMTISLTNPNAALLVTAQTTLAYPLKISLNDLPRTTYVKVPSGGDLDLRVLKAGRRPTVTVTDNQLGIYVNAGVDSSSFEYYFKRVKVCHGTLDIPPSASYTIDNQNSGLTFSEDDNSPEVTATLQDLISTVVQLVGHGVDLDYKHSTGSNNFKIIVRNIGVVRDNFNLSVVGQPSYAASGLGEQNVTLDPGESTQVDLHATGPEVPVSMISPGTSASVWGMNENAYSASYYVSVKALCTANTDVYDIVEVPTGTSSSFTTSLTLGNTNVTSGSSLSFKNTFIHLIGNVTINGGGELDLGNSTVDVEPGEGRPIIIHVINGAVLNLNNTDVTSNDENNDWELDVRGLITVARRVTIRKCKFKLSSNLDLSLGSRLALTNSILEIGEQGVTPTVTVHKNSALELVKSTVRSYSPSQPYSLRGGGTRMELESQTRDFLSYGVKIETASRCLHIKYPGEAIYPIIVTNTGNLTDQITLQPVKIPPSSQWQAQLDQTVFTLPPGQTSSTYLHVRPLVSVPVGQIQEVDVIGQSLNDPEVSFTLKTYTKVVAQYSLPHLDIDDIDVFVPKEKPIEQQATPLFGIIHNDGDTTATNVQVTFYDQTTMQTIAVTTIPAIPPRSQTTVTVTWNIAHASTHRVQTTAQCPQGMDTTTTDIAVKSTPNGEYSAMLDEDPPLTAYTYQPIYFDAFNFTDPDGNMTECLWDFGGGVTASGPLIVYSYPENGTKTITLNIIDSYGAETTQHITFTILNRPPIASFTANTSAAWPQEIVAFNASSSSDLDGNIKTFTWNFGDTTHGSGMIATHQYAQVGDYNITLTVTDNDGANSTYQISLEVVNPETIIYDVGIVGTTTSVPDPEPGETIQINVTAANFGNFHSPTQTFDVTLFMVLGTRTTRIEGQTITLNSPGRTNVTFSLTLKHPGWQTFLAVASQVPHEENLENNQYSFRIVVFCPYPNYYKKFGGIWPT
jgi:uncharacterized membrane protein